MRIEIHLLLWGWGVSRDWWDNPCQHWEWAREIGPLIVYWNKLEGSP